MTPFFASRAFWTTLFLAFVLCACGPKVSAENYDKIVKGLKEEEVARILGIASESRNAAITVEGATFTSTQSKWRNDKGTIVVYFQNGEVDSKHYFAPGTEPAAARRY